MKVALAVIMVMGMGCSGNASDQGSEIDSGTQADSRPLPVEVPDASPSDSSLPDGPLNACASLRDAWIADYNQVGKSCVVKEDCTLVGQTSFQSCNGVVFVGPKCGGAGVNKAAFQGTDLAARASAWATMCGSTCATKGVPCIPDCAPGTVDCVQGVCKEMDRSCLPLPDAGVKDAS